MTVDLGNKFFKLYSCCIPVVGASRSVICDLQRSDFIFVPNEIAQLFLIQDTYTLKQLSEKWVEYIDFEKQLLEYIDYLIENEYGFFTDKPELFPELSEQIHFAENISNAIIDIGEEIRFDISRFIKELSALLCQSVAIRIFHQKTLTEVECLLALFQNSTIRSLEIFLPYTDEFENEESVFKLLHQFPICKTITFYASTNRNDHYKEHYQEIIYTDFILNRDNCCGQISPYYFRVNNQSFFEAKKFNSCLNKKISVDSNGLVANCPSMKEKFGHFDSIDSLRDVIGLREFSYLWKLTKDQINVCKDCEFRYICHDCRAFTVDQTDIQSKPLNCKYNPYEATWA